MKKRGKTQNSNKTSLTVANTMKIAKLCVAIETKCRQKCWPNLIGEKQRDKNETILWHIHIIYIYIQLSVYVCALIKSKKKQ